MLIKSRRNVTEELIIGKVFTEIIGMTQDSYEIIFKVNENEYFKMYHEQDCCENVEIEDVVGNVENLLNTPILGYEVKTQEDENASESGTFTFYTFRTIKGYVDIRWYGESNGYYSEEVDFVQCIQEEYDESCLIPYDIVRVNYKYGEYKNFDLWYPVDTSCRNRYYKVDDVYNIYKDRR